jgi:hypothetical protein
VDARVWRQSWGFERFLVITPTGDQGPSSPETLPALITPVESTVDVIMQVWKIAAAGFG